ncbi:MAG: sugar phosphate isomerase/epimerase family protein [Spirochaetota bacterium]
MKIGVSSYTWTWAVGIKGYEPPRPLDAFGLIEKAGKTGAAVLQLADNPPLHHLEDTALREIAAAAARTGVRLEAGTRGIEPGHLARYLQIAGVLGSPLVRTITHRLDEEAASMLREVLPDYEVAGVCIALENHDEHTTGELAGFVDRMGSRSLGVCLDTVNSFAALEPPRVVVQTLAPYTVNLHVKDFDVVRVGHQLGFSIEGRPAGEGRLDIPWMVRRLQAAGRDPSAILELWTPFSGDIRDTVRTEDAWAARSLEYLRGVITES